MTEEEKADAAIQDAFNALVESAKRNALTLSPTVGLMYMPDDATAQQFIAACRAVLKSLSTP